MAIVTLPRPSSPEEATGASEARQADRVPVAARRGNYPPLAAVVVAVVAAGAATAWSAATHSMVLYGDARAHLDVARHVTDALTPGLAQLGSVWLPLPHILLVPFVAITPLWHNGAAGAIVSGLCFVYTALRIFSLVDELSASKVGAWVGMAVFIANLNMLYIQSTALTEPVLLALLVGTVYHLSRWMRTLAVRDLLWASLMVFGATLTRYEGWALLVAALAAVAVWSRLSDRRAKSAQANLVLFAAIGCYGLILWLLYNLIIFHDALYFLHSAYSAQAINGAQAQFGLLGTKGSVWQSTLTYGWDVVDVVGGPVVIAAGLSIVALAAIRHPERRRTLFSLGLLAAPVIFEIMSLYAGQTTIRVPQLFPHQMWNDRYGVVALPLCAVAAGVLVGRWKWSLPVVVGATALATLFMAIGTPLTLADGRTGTSSAAGGHPEVAAAYLSHHYRGGAILADDSAASSLMFASGLDLKQFITVGFHPYFAEALADPEHHVTWVVAYPGDAVTADMKAHPGRFRDFHLVITQGRARVFVRTFPYASVGAAGIPPRHK
jgi:hypothetical protein